MDARATLDRVPARSATALVLAAAVLLMAGCAPEQPAALPAPSQSPSASSPTPTPPPSPLFDRGAKSIDDPNSIWVVADKLRPLNPVDYTPADLERVPIPYVYEPYLRAEAAQAAVALVAAAQAEGLRLQSQSAYRGYDTQVAVYGDRVNLVGQEEADRTSARPGHSEHQTGLSIDFSSVPAVCPLEQCFADTPHGQWLAENAWRFGFHLRYPEGETPVTGYVFEPWHYRYVGVELATELHESGILTLEEFFGLSAAPDYAG